MTSTSTANSRSRQDLSVQNRYMGSMAPGAPPANNFQEQSTSVQQSMRPGPGTGTAGSSKKASSGRGGGAASQLQHQLAPDTGHRGLLQIELCGGLFGLPDFAQDNLLSIESLAKRLERRFKEASTKIGGGTGGTATASKIVGTTGAAGSKASPWLKETNVKLGVGVGRPAGRGMGAGSARGGTAGSMLGSAAGPNVGSMVAGGSAVQRQATVAEESEQKSLAPVGAAVAPAAASLVRLGTIESIDDGEEAPDADPVALSPKGSKLVGRQLGERARINHHHTEIPQIFTHFFQRVCVITCVLSTLHTRRTVHDLSHKESCDTSDAKW